METYWGSKRKTIAQFPAKIFFQKSSSKDSSESKSKIKNSIFNVIKSDKSKSKIKSDLSVKSLEPELISNEDEFINKVSNNNNQNLNKVKKSSSFSSTTSLATSSSSDHNLNGTNKENDCELNNLISEFSNSFNAYKDTYLSNHQNLIINESNSTELNRTDLNRTDLNKTDLNRSELNSSKSDRIELNRSKLDESESTRSELDGNELNRNEISRTKIRLVKQQSLDETSNSSNSSYCTNTTTSSTNNQPPKAPTRVKSTSKLNKVQRELNVITTADCNSVGDGGSFGSTTIDSLEQQQQQQLTQNSVKCSTIKITNHSSVNYSPQSTTTNGQQSTLVHCNSSIDDNRSFLNDLNNLNNEQQQTNKLTINVQANDKPIKLDEQKSVKKNDYQLTNMKSELILDANEATSVKTVEQQSLPLSLKNNGLWSNDNLNKSKRSKSVKQMTSRDLKNYTQQQLSNSESINKQTAVKKSNTMHFDLRSTNVLDKNALDKSSLDKSSLDRFLDGKNSLDNKNILKQSKLPIKLGVLDRKIVQEKRSIDESVNKLVNKSISRLADRSNGVKSSSIKQPFETVKNKSCSYLDQSLSVNQMTASLNLPNKTIQKSRIPYSKSSITLSKFDNNQIGFSSNHHYAKNRTDNCLDLSSSSSSSCSLCTSMSEDSLDSVNKSRTSSLSNLNSPLPDHKFQNSKIKTSNSMSKINQKLELLQNERSNQTSDYYPFKNGTRSLSNLTSYNLAAHTNRRLLKATSNHLFDRELSRIDESVDDDQEQNKSKIMNSNKLDHLGRLDYSDHLDRLNHHLNFKLIQTNNEFSKNTKNQTNQSIDTNHSIISSSLDCMEQSSNRSFNTATSNLSSIVTNISSKNNTSISTPSSISNTPLSINTLPTINALSSPTCTPPTPSTTNIPLSSSTNAIINTSSKAPLNQFKSSLINQLIDSNSHLKNNLCLGQTKLDEQQSNLSKEQEADEDESSLANLNENQKTIFNSKKNLFAKNRSLMNKTDSCRSFEMNERIVDLEMQLNSHKTKFNESLNLIKLLSEHCNDLIEVFNETYNCKLQEIAELVNENQHLIELNDEYRMENLNLNETCNDLKKHLNQELNERCSSDDYLKMKYLNTTIKESNFVVDLDQQQKYQELEERYEKLKNDLQYSRELYERVKSKALEKVESANKLIENANANNERELQMVKMQIKKKEQAYAYKIAKLESELELKSRENHELNQLLDEMVSNGLK